MAKIKGILSAVDEAIKKNRSTIRGSKRKSFPGVYEDPRLIAEKASLRSAKETNAMKELFGVTRDELYELTKQTRGLGSESVFQPPLKSRGSDAAKAVMQNQNKQRLIDILSEAGKYEGIYKGMDSWYNLDPMYKIMVDLFGEEEAKKRFLQLNSLSGMSSPMADVVTETGRGTAANWLLNSGKFDDFVKYGGQVKGRPEYMGDFPGHLAHKTAQLPAMTKYAESGKVEMGSPKVPVYINASTPESLGGSWRVPVGDAHWSRAVGLADTRPAIKSRAVPDQSVSASELADLTPWWKEISDAVGIEPVPAQARLWGTASHATGVKSPIGASKLEIISNKIMDQAKKRNIDPKLFRDYVLAGGDVKKLGLGAATTGLLAGVPAFAKDDLENDVTSLISGTNVSNKGAPKGSLKEAALSILRGLPLGVMDTFALLGKVSDYSFGTDNSKNMEEFNRKMIPDYDAKYLTDEQKKFYETIGSFLSPL